MSLASALGGAKTVGAGPALVGVLVDKSGSMHPYQSAVTAGVNQLVLEQQKIKGAGNLALAEFSHTYQTIFNQQFSKIDSTFSYNYQPEGGTCLYDSIETMTTDFEKQITTMAKKPKKVVIAVLTDGEDTGCKNTVASISKLLERKTKEGWEYMLLGALPRALEIAGQIGIPKDRAAVIDPNNIKGSIDFINQKLSESRKGKRLMISDKERETLALPPAGKTEL
jgi:hypothetical protein